MALNLSMWRYCLLTLCLAITMVTRSEFLPPFSSRCHRLIYNSHKSLRSIKTNTNPHTVRFMKAGEWFIGMVNGQGFSTNLKRPQVVVVVVVNKLDESKHHWRPWLNCTMELCVRLCVYQWTSLATHLAAYCKHLFVTVCAPQILMHMVLTWSVFNIVWRRF